MSAAEHIAELEKIVKKHERLDIILIAFFGLNAFLAANAILNMDPGILQTAGVSLNVAACVYGWHVIRKAEATRAKWREMIAQAKRDYLR